MEDTGVGGNPTRNERTDELGSLPRGLSPDTRPFLNPQALSPKTVSYLTVEIFRSAMELHFLFATSSFVSGNDLSPTSSVLPVCLGSPLP